MNRKTIALAQEGNGTFERSCGRTLLSAAFDLNFRRSKPISPVGGQSQILKAADQGVRPTRTCFQFSRPRHPGWEVDPPGGATTGWEAARHRESCKGELDS